jgi:hypothetical protein
MSGLALPLGVRFGSAQRSARAFVRYLKKPLDLALQNDFRVLLVVPLWLT